MLTNKRSEIEWNGFEGGGRAKYATFGSSLVSPKAMDADPLAAEARTWSLAQLVHFLVIIVTELGRRLRYGEIGSLEVRRIPRHRSRSRSP